MTVTVLDLLRHGEPEGGIRFRGGGLDDALSEKGWQQMWAAVASTGPWDHIYTSPMQRCRPFAAALAERDGLPLTEDERLREVAFGAWEGKTRRELLETDKEAYHRFFQNPVTNRPPGAEPLETFYQRVTTALRDLVSHHPGERLLLVVHAGVVRAAITEVLSAPLHFMYRIRVDSAALTRLRHSEHGHRELVQIGIRV